MSVSATSSSIIKSCGGISLSNKKLLKENVGIPRFLGLTLLWITVVHRGICTFIHSFIHSVTSYAKSSSARRRQGRCVCGSGGNVEEHWAGRQEAGFWFQCCHCWWDTAQVTCPSWASVSSSAEGEVTRIPLLPAAAALPVSLLDMWDLMGSYRIRICIQVHSNVQGHILMTFDESTVLMQFSKIEAEWNPEGHQVSLV